MAKDLQFQGFSRLLWIHYRESAKTTWAKIKILHAIVYGYKKNIQWTGSDKSKAEKQILSVANNLQANKRLIRDFGQLYFTLDRSRFQKSRPKGLEAFVTENDVSVSCNSTRVSTRGEIAEEARPDLRILDDIENEKTKKSEKKTDEIIKFIGEMLTGTSVDCDIIVLANRISDKGVVKYVEQKAGYDRKTRETKSRNWHTHEVKLIEKGVLVWASRYVWTHDQAEAINEHIEDRKKHVKSVQGMKEDSGTSLFNQEFLNDPISDGSGFVKKDWFQTYSKAQLFKDEENNWYFRPSAESDSIKATKVATTIDPSASKKQTADERSIMTGARFDQKIKLESGKIRRKQYYLIFRCIHGIWSMSDFAKKVAKERDVWSPHKIMCESNAVQVLFRELFQMYGISTLPLNPDADKVRRFLRHTADIEFGVVLIPDDGSLTDFVDEAVDFTGEDGKQDNQVDTYSYLMQELKGPRKKFAIHKLG